MTKLRLEEARPVVLRLDIGVYLGTNLKILGMISQPTPFYEKELAVRGPRCLGQG